MIGDELVSFRGGRHPLAKSAHHLCQLLVGIDFLVFYLLCLLAALTLGSIVIPFASVEHLRVIIIRVEVSAAKALIFFYSIQKKLLCVSLSSSSLLLSKTIEVIFYFC